MPKKKGGGKGKKSKGKGKGKKGKKGRKGKKKSAAPDVSERASLPRPEPAPH